MTNRRLRRVADRKLERQQRMRRRRTPGIAKANGEWKHSTVRTFLPPRNFDQGTSCGWTRVLGWPNASPDCPWKHGKRVTSNFPHGIRIRDTPFGCNACRGKYHGPWGPATDSRNARNPGALWRERVSTQSRNVLAKEKCPPPRLPPWVFRRHMILGFELAGGLGFLFCKSWRP